VSAYAAPSHHKEMQGEWFSGVVVCCWCVRVSVFALSEESQNTNTTPAREEIPTRASTKRGSKYSRNRRVNVETTHECVNVEGSESKSHSPPSGNGVKKP
jgi:hypothetical protein